MGRPSHRKISLNAATATGAGEELVLNGRTRITWDYTTTGTPSAISIKLQLLFTPGGTWRDADGGALTSTTGDFQTEVATSAISSRLNWTALTGGTNPTLTGWIVASDG